MPRLLIEDVESRDVVGKQVGRALHPGKIAPHGLARLASAKVVLPRPGRSSISKWPGAKRQASTYSMTAAFPHRDALSVVRRASIIA